MNEQNPQQQTIFSNLKRANMQSEDLRIKRSQMQNTHAKEIGAIDNALNKLNSEISALISML